MKDNNLSGHDLWDQKLEAYKKTGHCCAHCGRKFSDIRECTLEHIIPRYKGGTNDEYNLTVLCSECNQEKADFIINIDYYYQHILEEYRKDYYQYFRAELDRLRPYHIIQEDIAYLSVVEMYESQYKRIQALRRKKNKQNLAEQMLKACTSTYKIERAVSGEAEEVNDFVQKIYDNGGVHMNDIYFVNDMVTRRIAEEQCLYVIRGFGVDKEIKCVIGYRPLSDMDMPEETQEALQALREETQLDFRYITQFIAGKSYMMETIIKIRDQIWDSLLHRKMGMLELCHPENWEYSDKFKDMPAKLDGRECYIRIPKKPPTLKDVEEFEEEEE